MNYGERGAAIWCRYTGWSEGASIADSQPAGGGGGHTQSEDSLTRRCRCRQAAVTQPLPCVCAGGLKAPSICTHKRKKTQGGLLCENLACCLSPAPVYAKQRTPDTREMTEPLSVSLQDERLSAALSKAKHSSQLLLPAAADAAGCQHTHVSTHTDTGER
jgi:hypothetical protein